MYINIKIFIQPEEVYQYFLDHKKELKDNMIMIASTDIDDFDKKSFLFMTASEEGNLLLSLEAPEVIVDSEYCFEADTKDTVSKFLDKLDRLTPIALYKKRKNNLCEDYTCKITKEIDKYLIGLNPHYYSYLYDFGPFKKCNEHTTEEVYAYSIRSPGSTKGHIFVDENNIITELKFYEDSLHYFHPDVQKLEKEFIGYELIKEK